MGVTDLEESELEDPRGIGVPSSIQLQESDSQVRTGHRQRDIDQRWILKSTNCGSISGRRSMFDFVCGWYIFVWFETGLTLMPNSWIDFGVKLLMSAQSGRPETGETCCWETWGDGGFLHQTNPKQHVSLTDWFPSFYLHMCINYNSSIDENVGTFPASFCWVNCIEAWWIEQHVPQGFCQKPVRTAKVAWASPTKTCEGRWCATKPCHDAPRYRMLLQRNADCPGPRWETRKTNFIMIW